MFCDGLWTLLSEACPRRSNSILSDLNSVRNLNLLNRALSRADLYPTSNAYNLHQPPHTLTGNSTSSSSSCSSSGSTNLSNSNRLNHSSKAKIKDWLNNINQRWTQLLASMQCRPNGAHQLIHDCDSIKYGVVQYSKGQDPMQVNMYNYQLYSAAVTAATLAINATKQQMMANSKCANAATLNGLECGHHLCESLYGQTTKPGLLIGNSVNLSNGQSTAKTDQETASSLSSCAFNPTFSLPQSMINESSDRTSNFRSMLDLNAPLIYLDYNKGNLLLLKEKFFLFYLPLQWRVPNEHHFLDKRTSLRLTSELVGSA